MTAVASTEHNKEEYSFVYGDEAVTYEVVRKTHPEGKKRKITIKVHPNCDVIISAPEDAERSDIHEAVMKRAKWIYDALKEFRSHLEYVQPKNYVSGEMQFYLGRRYVLKIVEDAEVLPTVKMTRGKLLVTLTRFNNDKTAMVKALVRNWYKVRAERIFHERLSELLPQATWVAGIPSFRVLPMSKQWGSCSAKGTLMLNPHLIKAPKECIDYVILHELCHIAEHNHSDRFWRLLTSVMPNWKEVKSRLDGMAELYLNE
ncbi:M48 family metallopeptidase [Vibrio parahaemolyticus]|uniref:M48 family metallopeptidase n=1 Tax=Vibrio harveyi group TaxID=717610 RepID=UPI000C86D712|nr:SprT family zinc-dependent metalloprotease [Vibrio parahaemolyticus]EJB8690892.1 M48 family metallopeptidase [Vibrio parahaemolyticus]PMS42344.1 M48 family peptidase [Vibrio parahaemolyticus]PMS63150.1 M48 family peptidase [Vibrio parahaemolyticus]PMS69088.1 M48 family peptidase [Vibrio parahaemolyticus]PMS74032.1 M48 family peptidase [Vibrio parahaemolyticus]